ncbi:response regulator transcription factor [Gluconacetobacter diazotrophicus]|uniref:Response regulator transcription factor n=1 Tax=Gluconacetobacter diazotrophicus TaxID=33996 RepID=A0A7W4I3T3_GLUDI|nr:response regulator [Gluconacetobacter diazotrophicus]MBB2155254.1 response regulator transcription factor [Gluconacetobacter diazotrophicus]
MSGQAPEDRPRPHVVVVDDDAGVRASLDSLFRSAGFTVTLFADPHAFLKAGVPQGPCCLVLDVKLGRIDGLDFHEAIVDAGLRIPTIIMTGHGDIPMAVRGMRTGAIDFLAKPFGDQAMLSAVSDAVETWWRQRRQDQGAADARQRYATLSAREREVMALVVAGLMNKQIAARLSLSVVAIKAHRSGVMRKMGADSLADLVRLGERLGVRDEEVSRYGKV